MRAFEWPNKTDDPRPKGFRAQAFTGTDMEKDESTKLNLTMGHVMSLARVIVPLLSPLIGYKECPVWVTLCLHSKVLVWLLRSSFMEDELLELQRLLIQNAYLLAMVHPKLARKPKWHFCLHAVDEIRKYGPPRCTWTMKFENKHQQVKAALPLINFKSTVVTVAEIASMWLAMSSPITAPNQRTQSVDFCISKVSIIYGYKQVTIHVTGTSPYVGIFHVAGAPKEVLDFGEYVSIVSVRLRGHRYEIGSGVFLPSMRRGVKDRFGKITTIMMSTNEEECVLIAVPMLLEAPESDAEQMTCVVIDPTSPASNVFAIFVSNEPFLTLAHIFPKPLSSPACCDRSSWVILH